MELDVLLNQIEITKKQKSNTQMMREIFNHIIAFSLSITKPNYEIAFASSRVSEIYQAMKYYFVNNDILINSFEEINKIPIFPCLTNGNLLCYNIDEFLSSYGFIEFMKNNNIKKTLFLQSTEYILDCFHSPCCDSYFCNWSDEQIYILFHIIKYIHDNWTDYNLEQIDYYDDCEYFDYFFKDCKIIK